MIPTTDPLPDDTNPDLPKDHPTAPTRVHVTAMSLFSSRTFWLNLAAAVVGLLSATDVVQVVPPAWMPIYTMAIAAANVYLRANTVHPVSATLAPGTTKTVSVKLLTPPAPIVGD